MLLLAEIGDKVPTVAGTAVAACLIATVFLGLGLLRRWLALLALPVVAIYNWAIWGMVNEPGFGQMIVSELGWRHVIECFAGWNLPFVLAFGVIATRRRRFHERGCCENCGYDLTGNVSGRCPECGGVLLGSVDDATLP